MTNSIKSFFVAAAMSVVLCGAGCAVSSDPATDVKVQPVETKNQPTETKAVETASADFPNRFKNDDAGSVPPADNQTKGFAPAGTQTLQDEAAVLAGVWRMSYKTSICDTQTELIFQNNGSYSGFTQCSNGAYAFHTVGTWRLLQSGAVRVQYTNYEPKEFQGNPIRIPDGETMYYRFLNRNQLAFSAQMIATRVQ